MAQSLDTSRFEAAVKRELAKVTAEARRAVTAAGEEAAQNAAGLAPRESGKMADSIEATPGANTKGPFSDVTVEPFYSTFVEFGTSRQPARPFIRPSTQAAAARHLRRRK